MKFSRYAIFAIAAICAACAVATDPPGGPNVPIGPITPGSPTTITPNAAPVPYASIQGPSPTMDVVAQDILDLSLVVMNSQNSVVQFANLATTAIGTPGVVTSGRVFVDGVGWYGYTSGTPFTANGITVVTATAMGGGQWVHESVAFDNISSLALVSDLDTRTITSRAFVKGFGWYSHAAVSGAATSQWVRPATGVGSGEWQHELINLIVSVQLPVIGPAPFDGVIFPVGTASGRLNRSIIDHGYFAHQISPIPNAYTLLLTTATPTPQLTVPTIPQCHINDVVRFSINASVRSNAAAATQCQVWTEISENGGSTWTAVTSGSTLFMIVPASGATQTVGLGFSRTFGATTGDLEVRIVALSDGTHEIGLSIDSYELWVTRP